MCAGPPPPRPALPLRRAGPGRRWSLRLRGAGPASAACGPGPSVRGRCPAGLAPAPGAGGGWSSRRAGRARPGPASCAKAPVPRVAAPGRPKGRLWARALCALGASFCRAKPSGAGRALPMPRPACRPGGERGGRAAGAAVWVLLRMSVCGMLVSGPASL